MVVLKHSFVSWKYNPSPKLESPKYFQISKSIQPLLAKINPLTYYIVEFYIFEFFSVKMSNVIEEVLAVFE